MDTQLWFLTTVVICGFAVVGWLLGLILVALRGEETSK